MAFDKDAIIASLKEASISDLNDLVKAIEEEFDVSAAAPVAVAGAAGGDAAAKDSFTVELTEPGSAKVKVILRLLRTLPVLVLRTLRTLLMVLHQLSRKTLRKTKLTTSRKSLKPLVLLLPLSSLKLLNKKELRKYCFRNSFLFRGYHMRCSFKIRK